MLSNEILQARLSVLEGVEYVQVRGDGYHYHLIIVADAFIGQSRVARQQWVYSHLKTDILAGSLHAISMETLTKDEWEKKNG